MSAQTLTIPAKKEKRLGRIQSKLQYKTVTSGRHVKEVTKNRFSSVKAPRPIRTSCKHLDVFTGKTAARKTSGKYYILFIKAFTMLTKREDNT